MKKLAYTLVIAATVGLLAACDGTPTAGNSPEPTPPTATATATPTSEPTAPSATGNTAQGNTIEIGDYGFDDIARLDAAGCGMTLWRAEESTASAGDRRFILLNGLDDDSMIMRINGEDVRFNRTAASGEEFYGQRTSQTFVSQNGGITVTANVELGERGEIESVAIREGTVRVEQGSAVVEIPVAGDAGC
ncbi:hypothetical protein ACQ4M4_16480 [Leptolyngbya sp. AN02str]|uniref:hypothetical protein n=1 Tax=Leptolyngbya sp. AN02str TaxID=3423363 RepID=UPI003D320B1E